MQLLCQKDITLGIALWRETGAALCEANLPAVTKTFTGKTARYVITSAGNFVLGVFDCNGVGCPDPDAGGGWDAECVMPAATVAGTMRGTLTWDTHARDRQKWTWTGLACINGGLVAGYAYCTLSATLNGAPAGTVTGGTLVSGDSAGSLNLDVAVVPGDLVVFTLFIGISSGTQTHTIQATVTIL